MKILQVNVVYGEESTGKIVADIHHYLLNNGFDSLVCYGRGNTSKEQGVYRICSDTYARICKVVKMFFAPKYGSCIISTRKLERFILSEKPDVVHLHCINGDFINIYRLIRFLKEKEIPTLLTLHAEFMYTAGCGYSLECDRWLTGCGECPRLKEEIGEYLIDMTHQSWQYMKDSFDGFNEGLIVSSVSPWLMDRAKISPILMDKEHRVVLNGIDTEVFRYAENSLKAKLGLEGKKVVLYVTASFNRPIKGGKYVLELARSLPEYSFVIVGNEDPIEDRPDNVITVGRINDQKVLAEYYSMADMLLLTSQKETFCMPVAESLCCGTPVVGFEAGAPEQIALSEYSCFVSFGEVEKLASVLTEYCDKQWNKKEISDTAVRRYSLKRMAEEYINLYMELTGTES